MYDELPTYEDFHKHFLPVLLETNVHCAICDRSFRRITHFHLQTHRELLISKRRMKSVPMPAGHVKADVDQALLRPTSKWTQRPETLVETYTRLFGPSSLVRGLINQTIRLYRPLRTDWALMDLETASARWITVTPETRSMPYSYYLNDQVLTNHFKGRHTLAITPKHRGKTSVVVFDVDAKPKWGESASSAEKRAKRVTIELVLLLQHYNFVPHVAASGSKGYHVTLYFATPIPREVAHNLYQYFVHHPDLPREDVNIECLPLQAKIKLPLGIHGETRKFCTFVDPLTLVPMPDPYRYYLSIQPINPEIIDTVQPDKKVKAARARDSRVDEFRSTAILEVAYKVGIKAPGTRHNTTFLAAVYLLNHLKVETFQELFDGLVTWSSIQFTKNRENIRRSWGEHMRDLKDICRYVWKKRPVAGIETGVSFTAGDVHWIRAQTPNLATQKLLFAALYQYRLAGSGNFYFGFTRMQRLTGLANHPLSGAIKELRNELGILTIVQNYSHQPGLRRGKTAKYTLSKIPPAMAVPSPLVVVTPKTWQPDLWFQILQLLFTQAELKKWYPFAYHRILQVPPLDSAIEMRTSL
ncbi:MAG TPA: hypothetical protein GX517_13380 [Alicyclobacillus sp.]|nr:hypothetical protein [Alicyclobacillus sp.]